MPNQQHPPGIAILILGLIGCGTVSPDDVRSRVVTLALDEPELSKQPTVLDGLAFDPFSFQQDGFRASAQRAGSL